MQLKQYIEQLGGLDNIKRVLIPDERLIFEIDDLAKIDSLQSHQENAKIEVNATLNQVSFSKPENLTQSDLLEIDKELAARQIEDSEQAQIPQSCEYRPSWHISPPQGLLNDPNGFIYHQGQYHLFYQWYPHDCVHKDKYWVHLTSSDLVNWQWQSVALTPSAWCDSHGVFSGHAVSCDQTLFLFYTGNVRIGEARDRHTTQCLATSSDGIHFEKHGPVITQLPPNVTPHCRDPKVVQHGESWLMLLGVQTTDLKGRLALYRSDDLYTWEFKGIYGDELGDFGYMWECPDLFSLNGQTFVVIGPQGIVSKSPHHHVQHHNAILKAKLTDSGDLRLTTHQTLDHGFDFYAPQTSLSCDGRRLLCAWMGLPDEINQPSVENGWVHQLTSMRELTYKDGVLYQTPIEELKQLRAAEQIKILDDSSFDLGSNCYELKLNMQWGSELTLFQNESYQVKIALDKTKRRLIFDRSHTLIREGDVIRELPLQSEAVDLHILVDTSSVEVFVNGGEQVLTSRVFVPEDATQVSLIGKAEIKLWLLNPAKP
ncbi:MAG: glycoside hydrolase family 32 protein, partial [Vibrio sp.]